MLISGIGQVFHRGEYWMLLYDTCRHEQYFQRTGSHLFDNANVEAQVRELYAACGTCAWAPIEARLREQFNL